MSQKGKQKSDGITRIAVVLPDRCRPQKCGLLCKANCPVNKLDKKCIVVTNASKRAEISEQLCIGCNICVKKCPFNAICIENLPSALDSQVSFRYGQNSFKLHRLPTPKPGVVLGLVGENGTGKSTALQILKNELQPNFGDFSSEMGTAEIIKRFRGTDLQQYLTRLYKDELRVSLKIQYVDLLIKTDRAQSTVYELVGKYEKKNPERYKVLVEMLEMEKLMDRQVNQLSGGELQRFSLLFSILKDAEVTLIDEPSSYLDIKQRLTASRVIRSIVEREVGAEKYVIVVEHDLAVLDYLSDNVSLLYGQPGVYGIITLPYGCGEGINAFLRGYLPTENVRFRREVMTFPDNYEELGAGTEAESAAGKPGKQEKQEKPGKQEKQDKQGKQEKSGKSGSSAVEGEGADLDEPMERAAPHEFSKYPDMTVKVGSFTLHVEGGSFSYNQITLILGENGTGKTCFIKTIAGSKSCAPKFENPGDQLPQLSVSLKPQTLSPNFEGSVQELLNAKLGNTFHEAGFQNAVFNHMGLKHLLDRKLKHLSGGELQRVALTLALGKNADVYLIDEPSAYLDATQRLLMAKVIKRYILSLGKCAYVVEHDFLMSMYLADRVIVFDGVPGIECTARKPCSKGAGMNSFLRSIQVTFRRDKETKRPRVNKPNSAKDKDQKISGVYFSMVDDDAK